jgi:hypothetical protein
MPNKNPEERKKYNREYYLTHKKPAIRRKESSPEARKEYERQWYQLNKERIAQRSHEDLERRRTREARRLEGPEGDAFREKSRKYHTQWRRENGLHTRIVLSLGSKCVGCGIEDPDVLQVDHINGGGSKERKSFSNTYQFEKYVFEHVDSGEYQLLCANCNWKKRYTHRETYRR